VIGHVALVVKVEGHSSDQFFSHGSGEFGFHGW